MPIGRTTIIVNCQHLIEKSLVRKTRFLDFHRGKLATRISEILLYSHIFSSPEHDNYNNGHYQKVL